MVEYVWPSREESSLLGKSFDKVDAPAKCTGAAKYSYDINPDKVLIARALGSRWRTARSSRSTPAPPKRSRVWSPCGP